MKCISDSCLDTPGRAPTHFKFHLLIIFIDVWNIRHIHCWRWKSVCWLDLCILSPWSYIIGLLSFQEFRHGLPAKLACAIRYAILVIRSIYCVISYLKRVSTVQVLHNIDMRCIFVKAVSNKRNLGQMYSPTQSQQITKTSWGWAKLSTAWASCLLISFCWDSQLNQLMLRLQTTINCAYLITWSWEINFPGWGSWITWN